MSFVDAVRSCLRQFATVSGRARRAEYWWFQLALLLAYLVLVVVTMVVLSLVGAVTSSSAGQGMGLVVVGLFFPAYLALAVPAVTVGIRRLHDIGRTGWWFLIALVPFGGIVLLVFHVNDSQPGANPYGPNPKGVAAHAGPVGFPGPAPWSS